MTNGERSREEFEKLIGLNKYNQPFKRKADGTYFAKRIEDKWWGFQAGESSMAERAAQALDDKRKVLCQGCLRGKPLVRPEHASSIVGGAGIHTPEGWVCVADLAIEAVRALAPERGKDKK